MLNSPAAGLGTPTTFGTPRLYPTIEYPLTDETQLAVPTGASIPPPVAVFPVPDARPIARTESPSDPLLVAGDGQGLVEAAAAGLLASNPTIFYSATFAHDPAGLSRQLGHGAVLVLTDTNRKQLSTWGTVVDNYGYVEQANETPLVDNPAEASLPVFPDAGSGTQTVAVVDRGGLGAGHRLLQPDHQHRREPARSTPSTGIPTRPGPRGRSARPPTRPSRSSWSTR